jgi:hypothetical protein
MRWDMGYLKPFSRRRGGTPNLGQSTGYQNDFCIHTFLS